LNRVADRRQVLAAIGVGTALSLMGDAALYAVLPTHTDQAGVALASVGLLLSANRWVRLILNNLAGFAYDRWPRRWFFVGALFLGALSTASYAFAPGFWPLLAGRLAWGLAWSGIWVGGNTILLDVATPEDRGRWTGLYQFSFYFGSALGTASGGVLTDWLGYHRALLVAAIVTLVGAVVALVLLPETRGWHSTPQSSLATGVVTAPPPVAPARDPLASATLLYTVNRFVIAGVMLSTLGLLIQQNWPADSGFGVATLTGALLALNTVIAMLIAPLAGQWSDKAGNRWRVAGWALTPGVLGMGLLVAGSPAAILAGVPLNAVAGGSSQSLATAMLGDSAGERRARALGWMHTFGDLGSAAAPLLAYVLLPWLGLSGVYALCAVLVAGMWLWALRLSQRSLPVAAT
jgi:MFS family permease